MKKRIVLMMGLLVPACGSPALVEQNDQPEPIGTTAQLLGAGWCGHSSGQLAIGDFNGDGRDDLLCHDTSTGYKWIAYANVSGDFNSPLLWEGNMGWCVGAEVQIGDFNGDHRADLLCHDTSGNNWIALADTAGHFGSANASSPTPGKSWHMPILWCVQNDAGMGSWLQLGDFNGDGHTDLMCHRYPDGYTWIAFASQAGAFDGTSWQTPLNWCGGVYGDYPNGFWGQSDIIYSGSMHNNFPNGPKDDLLCHTWTTGRTYQIYSNPTWPFNPPYIRPADAGDLQQNWCNSGGAFYTGDFNGDGQMDMLCRAYGSGYTWIAQSPFTAGYNLTTWEANMNGWCEHSGAKVLIGDYNGDGHDDMMCFTQPGYAGAGEKWIAFAKLLSGKWGFTGTDWHSF